LFRKSAADAGHNPATLPLAINSQMYIGEHSDTAAEEFWPTYEKLMNRVGEERGWSPITRGQYEYLRSPEGPLFVGSVQEVVDKIVYQSKLFNNTRFLAQIIKGDLSHDKILNSIELFGRKVAPAVRQQLQAEQ
jgi:alkanesulfonate monooxygenase SsuD/methylene tetrahydromethanopterin reductase-like flavin-dependent oxidoreductase (luciferase family)